MSTFKVFYQIKGIDNIDKNFVNVEADIEAYAKIYAESILQRKFCLISKNDIVFTKIEKI